MAAPGTFLREATASSEGLDLNRICKFDRKPK